MQKKVFAGIFATLAIFIFFSCKHDVPKSTYCFEREILPIIKSNCANGGCHSAADASGGYVLDGYDNIIKKGVIPGNAAASKLYTCLFSTASDPMPNGTYPLLDDKSKEMIKTWINEGAMNRAGCTPPCIPNSASFSKDVQPILRTNCYGCHNAASANDFGAGYVMEDYTTITDIALNGDLIIGIEHDPSTSGMPKYLKKLTDCQISVIKKWVADGAPNN
jgi:hypothetical protein